MKKTRKGCPLKLDFDAPSCTESLFSLFQICSISAKLGGQQSPELSLMGAYGSKKTAGERFRNHVKTKTQQYQQMSQICSQRRGPQSNFFVFFRVPSPGWSPGRPRTGSKAQKHVKMEAPRWIFWYFTIIV